METYWDLTGAERAALTDEDVSRYCDLALMAEGVLRPKSPKLLPEEPPAFKGRSFYALEFKGKYGQHERGELLFETMDEALSVLPRCRHRLLQDYGDPDQALPLEEPRVVMVTLPEPAEVAARKGELERCRAAKTHNEREKKAQADAVKKVDEALKGIWDDYREQRRLADRVDAVRATWTEYLVMAGGDARVARGFLTKAYPSEHWGCRGDLVDLVREAIGDEGMVPSVVERPGSEL